VIGIEPSIYRTPQNKRDGFGEKKNLSEDSPFFTKLHLITFIANIEDGNDDSI